MTLTVNGCSTTKAKGQFAYEIYNLPQSRTDIYRGKPPEQRVQWDYRDSNGKLFSGIARTVEQAKEAARNQSGEQIV